MTKRLFLLLFTLSVYVGCNSVYQPEPDPPDSSEPPVLQSPENNSYGISTDISLQWQEVRGASSYNVQVATDQNFTGLVADTSVHTTSFEPTELENGTFYFWRVNSGPEPVWSEVRSFMTTQAPSDPPPATSSIWVSAYLASWNHYAPPGGNWGNISAEDIDWNAFTHLIYFSMTAKADGELSTIADYENMSPDRINAIVSAAHQHEKPVLISIGGWGNYDGFSQAITPEARASFIDNLVSLIETWGFDGIDLDMEPIRSGDAENYKALIRELHAALQSVTTPLGNRPYLTAATSWSPELFSELQQYFDQINLMTYDFSGAWEGWVSWHNSAIYDGGLTFPGTNRPLPSVDGKLQSYINAGIAREKLGVGIDFYGYVWNGYVTDPGQSLTPVAPQVEDNVPYHEIMNNYYSSDSYRWDNNAQAAYLHVNYSDPSERKFISYDDERSIQAKIDYIRQQKIGGVIIWELSGGYRSNQPAGSRDNLLQAVKSAVW